jgi:hypothetical protein
MTQKHNNNWDKLSPPARPSQAVINDFKSLVPDDPIFLLGVTPEIANVYTNVLAVDHDIKMIENVWPGNTDTKTVVNAHWETFMSGKTFNGVIGDVALTLLADKKAITNFNKKSFDMLNSGGTVAQRIFHKPKDPITRQHLKDILAKPATINFNAFKWMMFMCYADETHYKIKLTNIRKLFNEICPIREVASDITGWSLSIINSIDLYEHSDWEIIVMNKKEWLETVPKDASSVKFTYQDDYDLAELCPILSFSKHV